MLALHNIDVTLAANTPLQRQVLNNLQLTVAAREFAVIIGGNGAGKSTLFNVISGYLKPNAGKIFLNQQDITNSSQASRAAQIVTVMQDPRIGTMENLSIYENMAFAIKRGAKRGLLPFATSQRRRLFSEKLALLNMGLEDRLDELVVNLSGGQRQALSLITAILTDYKILLLDEITAALDPIAAQQVMGVAAQIVRNEARTCLMITHNMQHALEYADNIYILGNGSIIKKISASEKISLNTKQLAEQCLAL